MTDPNNQTVNYTYDARKRVTSVQTTTTDGTYRNSYTYTHDNLTSVTHNTSASTSGDVTYHFGYDDKNRPTTVKVGTQTLSTNTYNTTASHPNYGTLTESTFGNGGKVHYTYDEFNRTTGIRFDNDTSDRYTYAYGANGQVSEITDNALNRETQSEYDVANRPIRITHKENNAHLYTGEISYDEHNNLASFREQIGTARTPYQTNFILIIF